MSLYPDPRGVEFGLLDAGTDGSNVAVCGMSNGANQYGALEGFTPFLVYFTRPVGDVTVAGAKGQHAQNVQDTCSQIGLRLDIWAN
ncbi:MAG: hypothetical protein IE937_12345 [Gammaproteobacteria bacterium]|nr:hypothetical protein [Gammaproteobacteria bacterium]